jgi:hypothetical protein
VTDPWAAYCLDRAVYAYGSTLSNKLDSVNVKNDKDGKKTQAKRQRLLDKWIPDLHGDGPKFKDPGKAGT